MNDMTSHNFILSPQQIRAARALLAWSQSELAGQARVATSTVADFERSARNPVANNIQAIREAFEREGLEFVADGVVSRTKFTPPPPPRPGHLVRWVNATHLSQWGERRAGQSGMPEVLSRLIYASVGPAAVLRFPSDESVQYPGWDGVCDSRFGTRFVPEGASVWEIGAQRAGVRGKADEDFEKRSAGPLGRTPSETTFVFVTPQRFVGKDEWVAQKKALGIWRDVVALDADDLVHWLETYPAVARWLAAQIGRRPAGLRGLEDAWEEWSKTTQLPLTTDILLTDRDEEQTAVLRWLQREPEEFSLQAEAPEEAISFLYASLSPLPEAYRLAHLGRCVVADTLETARELVGLGTPLIIVMAEPDAGVAQRLISDGHHVFSAYGPNASAVARSLPRPWRFNLEQALRSAGFDDEQAHLYAHNSGRSLTVLRRILPAAPQFRTPWSSPAVPELIAAMLAGAWSDKSKRDREILSDLAGKPYDDVVIALAPLAELGGPLIHVGDVWKVASLRDLYAQIGMQVTSAQFVRFETAFQSVLGAINRRYDQKPKSPYFEEEGEFGEECSPALRRGLTEALIAFAVYPDVAKLLTDAQPRISSIVRRLLDKASPALWWSLSRDFQNIAEAAPDAFLAALETALEEDDPALNSLFRSDEGFMHPTEYLSNLLWALEMLARSPDWVTRSALVLARLDELDPGGKMGNRPGASLRRIFLSWSPQTYATPEQRLKVIDRIIATYPVAGWKLLNKLAPRSHDSSGMGARPNWRDFSSDRPEPLTWQAIGAAVEAVGDRLLTQVGEDPQRWADLIDHWAQFKPAWRAQASAQLAAYAQNLSGADVEALRTKVRKLVQRHRDYRDAEWAMPESDLQPLDDIAQRLEPDDVAERVRWLFQPGAQSLRPRIGWREQQELLEADQTAAAQELMAQMSPEALFGFAETVQFHFALGLAIARTPTPLEVRLELMQRAIQSETSAVSDTGAGVLAGLKPDGVEGEAWTQALWKRAIQEGWGHAAETRIVQQLDPTPANWVALDERSKPLADFYWKTLNTYRLPDDVDPNTVVDRLISVGRSREAVAWLGNNIERNPESALLIRALRAAISSDEELDGNDATMFSYYLGLVLGRLDEDPAIEERELVQLEWIYFQALKHSERPPKTLHKALSNDPDFFVDLLRMVYLPAKDSGVEEPKSDNPEQVEQLATQAWDVLHEWSRVPGSTDDGVIDGAALDAWVKAARKRLKELGRGDIGDSKIGEILSAARRTADEPWPPEPVREVIETARSRHLESGFEIGVYNRRGVTVRMPHDGGDQERSLAASYRKDAEALRFDWPRTSACLERIATTYEYDANREDLSAQQRDWL
ncbi:MAG: helix-turn-helix transcriptional regulator [Candidatus Brevundimonas colombiensis]|uniref:Helix-turn-helix transcriptional regulator n=1 Tax=Candidatus Brevundimonas colombiensis TaxID=3121376 RepID=A0AAJ5X2E4_9CAUL|nr:helix-turn-helix transcriptional regulator [Brevundimonas sp.]WEK40769.1 MAG: helix-turn-helix transcriptional regulator [Brevundimonas sp.]